MTNPANNPWLHMQKDTSRRVDVETKYNFFWIIDSIGSYGFLILFKVTLPEEYANKIKGISVVSKSDNESGKLYFVLNHNKDWEIFLSVCLDLIFIANKCSKEIEMIPIINQRIKRWQKFLSENNSTSMTEIQQMGLFTELNCLYNILLPNFGYKEAISCWVGPEYDKKDFSLNDFFVEVKSFISSKGQIIKISSLHQLDHEIKPLYLLAYGITKSEIGMSVKEIIKLIQDALPDEDTFIHDLFDDKLASYGYIENVTEAPFFNFKIDTVKSYIVSDDFPKIISRNVDAKILSVQYSIDLAKCSLFESKLPLFT